MKNEKCAFCDHAKMRTDISGIYCTGGFQNPDGTCDFLKKSKAANHGGLPSKRNGADATTNADRIRGMSDEELAAFMRDMMDCVSCRQVMSRHDITCTGNYNECVGKCKEWLLKPAEEE